MPPPFPFSPFVIPLSNLYLTFRGLREEIESFFDSPYLILQVSFLFTCLPGFPPPPNIPKEIDQSQNTVANSRIQSLDCSFFSGLIRVAQARCRSHLAISVELSIFRVLPVHRHTPVAAMEKINTGDGQLFIKVCVSMQQLPDH